MAIIEFSMSYNTATHTISEAYQQKHPSMCLHMWCWILRVCADCAAGEAH